MVRNILECMELVGSAPSQYMGKKVYVSTGAVDRDHIDYGATEQVAYETRPSRANLVAESGDILFAKMCATQKTLKISETTKDYLFSTGFCAVRAKTHVMIPELLYYAIGSRRFSFQKDKYSSGATQKAITNAGLKKIFIRVPPISEQRKIAAALDELTKLLSLRKQQLAKLDQVVRSQFLEMFGDAVLNPLGWAKKCFGAVCDVRDGTHASPRYYPTGFPLVTSKNVTQGLIDLTGCSLICEADYNEINKRSKVDVGDIIMPMIGTVGKPVIVDVEPNFAIKNMALIKFKPDSSVISVYIQALLQSDYFDEAVLSKVRGGTQKFISLGDIRKLEILVPPIELQNQFAAFVAQTDKEKSTIQQSLDKLETLKNAFMQQYF